MSRRHPPRPRKAAKEASAAPEVSPAPEVSQQVAAARRRTVYVTAHYVEPSLQYDFEHILNTQSTTKEELKEASDAALEKMAEKLGGPVPADDDDDIGPWALDPRCTAYIHPIDPDASNILYDNTQPIANNSEITILYHARSQEKSEKPREVIQTTILAKTRLLLAEKLFATELHKRLELLQESQRALVKSNPGSKAASKLATPARSPQSPTPDWPEALSPVDYLPYSSVRDHYLRDKNALQMLQANHQRKTTRLERTNEELEERHRELMKQSDEQIEKHRQLLKQIADLEATAKERTMAKNKAELLADELWKENQAWHRDALDASDLNSIRRRAAWERVRKSLMHVIGANPRSAWADFAAVHPPQDAFASSAVRGHATWSNVTKEAFEFLYTGNADMRDPGNTVAHEITPVLARASVDALPNGPNKDHFHALLRATYGS